MGINTLANKTNGDTIDADHINELQTALNGDFVPRNASGAPTAGQSLGTAALPWGTGRFNGIVVGGSALDTTLIAAPPFRVQSGATRSTSNHPAYLQADGAAASVDVLGATTSLVFSTNGVDYTLSSDITKGSLSVAPSSNNTCLVNDTDAADQTDTRLWGEENPFATKKEIVIDNVGSEITALDGKLAAFSHGAGPEYFIARIDTSNNRLHKCERGTLLDSSLAPIKREVFSNNDTLTLCQIGWLFLDNDLLTVDVTYNEPVYSFSAPSSPATGDYWFDLGNTLWKRYDGATFQTVSDRTYIGLVVLDDTNAVATRAEAFYKAFKADNSLELELESTSIVRAKGEHARVNVAGTEIYFGNSLPTWNITADTATSADMYTASEQSSTYYGVYLKDTGETVLSDIEPALNESQLGLYHPANNDWRFVGECYNDSGSDLVRVSDEVKKVSKVKLLQPSGHGSTAAKIRTYTTILIHTGTLLEVNQNSTDGDSVKVRRDDLGISLHASDGDSASAEVVGITKNADATDRTTDVQSISDQTKVLCINEFNQSITQHVSGAYKSSAGDVLRTHDRGGLNSTTTYEHLTIEVL